MTSTEYKLPNVVEETYDKARKAIEKGKKTLQKSKEERERAEGLVNSVLELAVQLLRKGFPREAQQIRSIAHYIEQSEKEQV